MKNQNSATKVVPFWEIYLLFVKKIVPIIRNKLNPLPPIFYTHPSPPPLHNTIFRDKRIQLYSLALICRCKPYFVYSTYSIKHCQGSNVRSHYLPSLQLWGGGGCNPKKPYPSLTVYRVGVGVFWVLLGFFGFFWVLLIFLISRILDITICTCYNINVKMIK